MDEMDLMLTRKSHVIETAKQEDILPAKELAAPREESARMKIGQMMQQNYGKDQNQAASVDSLADSIKSETENMDSIRQKGRIFMHRYEWKNRRNGN